MPSILWSASKDEGDDGLYPPTWFQSTDGGTYYIVILKRQGCDDLFINLDEVELKLKEEQRLEFHKGYIDVQVPLLQPETMGWTALSDLGKPDIAYNPTTDCGFYKQAAREYLKVEPGQFTVFFPEDAHAPIIGEGLQRKLVGKIRIWDLPRPLRRRGEPNGMLAAERWNEWGALRRRKRLRIPVMMVVVCGQNARMMW